MNNSPKRKDYTPGEDGRKQYLREYGKARYWELKTKNPEGFKEKERVRQQKWKFENPDKYNKAHIRW